LLVLISWNGSERKVCMSRRSFTAPAGARVLMARKPGTKGQFYAPQALCHCSMGCSRSSSSYGTMAAHEGVFGQSKLLRLQVDDLVRRVATFLSDRCGL